MILRRHLFLMALQRGRFDAAIEMVRSAKTAGQVRSAHRTRHVHIGEQQPDASGCFEQLHGLIRISGFDYPVTRIRQHVGCSHALEHIVIDDHNQRVGGGLGHTMAMRVTSDGSDLQLPIAL